MYEEMQRWVQSIIENSKLMEYRIGTVVQLQPLKISFGDNKIITDVGSNILYTEEVLEKKIELKHKHTLSSLGHSHSCGDGSTGTGLSSTYDTSENLMTYTMQQGIVTGDKLLMLRADKGQKWIVLSKLRDTNSILIKNNGDWS